MTYNELHQLILRKRSFLCIGLDSDITKIPDHLKHLQDPVFAFNKKIIDSTIDLAVAYKPNLAFYESRGIAGLRSLQLTMDYLESFKSEVFTIADAKRGDIGNTSSQYALGVFDHDSSGFNFDAITVAPYMGADSVKPFLFFPGKWVILLALTSNKGAEDFQLVKTGDERLFELVIEHSKEWGTAENMMYVVGATRAEMLADIREIIPDHFLLVPGVGAQGGSLAEVARYGMNSHCGLLVNVSRSILFASSGADFEEKARDEAVSIQKEMESLLQLL
ncbi:MAG: orotidine-5'-phosphate decarboxylase [Bacteroidales bacterium]